MSMYVKNGDGGGRSITGKTLKILFEDNSKSCAHCYTAQNTLKESKKNEETCNFAHFSNYIFKEYS